MRIYVTGKKENLPLLYKFLRPKLMAAGGVYLVIGEKVVYFGGWKSLDDFASKNPESITNTKEWLVDKSLAEHILEIVLLAPKGNGDAQNRQKIRELICKSQNRNTFGNYRLSLGTKLRTQTISI